MESVVIIHGSILVNLRKNSITKNRQIRSCISYSFIIVILFVTFPAYSSLHTVTNTGATGAGSLDAAVAAANADNSGSVQIGFNLPANSTISLQTPLFLQKSMTISTSTTFAPGAPNLTIINPTGVVFLAGVRPTPSSSTVQITIDGNNGSNGLIVTGTSAGGVGGGAGLGGALFVNQYTQVISQETQFINSNAQGGNGSPVPVVTPATSGGPGGGGMLGAAGGVGGNTAGGGGGGGALGYAGGAGGNTAGAGGGGGGGALGIPNLGGAGGVGGNLAGGGGGGGGAGIVSAGIGGEGGGSGVATPGGGGGGAAGAGALAGGGGGGVVGGAGGAAGAGNPGGAGTLGGGGGGGGGGANSPGGSGSQSGGGGGGGAGGTSPGLGGGNGGIDGGGGGGGGSGGGENGGIGGFGAGGGGGGTGATSPGGAGGFGGGGGGGGGGANSPGGIGGYGGGGGGGGSGVGGLAGLGGFGGGDGEAGDTVAATPGGGGGGAGFGGAVFVRGNDAAGVAGTFTSTNNTLSTVWSNNTAVGGLGTATAGDGIGDGEDLYLATGVTATFSVASGLTQSFSTASNTQSIGGGGGVIKNLAGNLIFTAQNTYSGGTTLTAGILTLGNNGSLGTGTLGMGGGSLQSNTTLNNITNAYTLITPSSMIGSNSFTMSGDGALGANALTVNNSVGTITLSGIISGLGGSIIKTGTGSLILNNANIYTGGTTLTEGALIVGNTSALGTGSLILNGGALQSNGSLSIANNYSQTAGSTINGANNLTLSGTSNLASSTTLLVSNTAGTVTLSNIISGAGGITLNGNSLVLSAANSYTGGTIVTAGTLQLDISSALVATGAVTVNGGTLDLNGTTQTIGDLSGNGGSITMGGGSLTFGTTSPSTAYSGVVSEAGNLIKQNSGAFVLSGNNSFSGNTRVDAGTLVIGNTNALGSSSLTLNGGTLQSNATFAISNNYLLTANSAINGTNSLTMSGIGALGSNVLTVANTVGTINLGGVISGVGGSILQNGIGGTLLLSGVGANTYTGGVTLTAGTLVVGKASALGTGNLVLNGGALQSNGSLSIANNFSQTANSTINGANNLTLSGTGNLGSNTTLLVNNTAGTITLSNAIGGAGGIALNGNILVLSGANSYTGGTIVTAGTLQLGTSNALAPIGGVTVNGGIFDVNGTTQTIGDLSGNGGSITMGGGSLTFGTVTPSTIYSGVISEAGNLIKQNSGTVILTGNNSFTGNTIINGGALFVNEALLGPVSVSANTILGGSGTIGGTVTNNGTVAPGSPGIILTILGDYNIAPTSTTNIQINPQGQTSVIAVQGDANLDGELTVTAEPGAYILGASYTFLYATGNVAGTFSSFPTSIGNLQTQVVYNATNTVFEFLISSVLLNLSASNQNQAAVGAYINSLSTPATGSDLAVTLGAFSLLSPQQVANALESISPGRLNAAVVLEQNMDVYINKMNTMRLESFRGVASDSFDSFETSFDRAKTLKSSFTNRQDLVQQTNNLLKNKSFNSTKHGKVIAEQNNLSQSLVRSDNPINIWFTPFGRYSNTNANSIDPRFNSTTAGFAAGIDNQFSEKIIFGASVGRYQSWINLFEFPDRIRVNTNFATVYGTWFNSGYYADISVVSGLPRYHSTHNIIYSNINRTSNATHNGLEIASHIGIGKAYYVNAIKVTPYVGLDYIHVSEKNYSLTGANSLDMNIQGKTANALYSEAGVKVSKIYSYNNKWLIPEFEISYTNINARNGNTVAALISQPGNFSVTNFSGSSYYYSTGLGIAVHSLKGGFFKAFYSSDFGPGYQAYEFNIRIGISF